ncbi:MAG: Holliday junction resolvase RuvX [Bacteroidales bacterium]|nr:Holliday junction resolvase RuvX [Bacteroidales bacterium]
MCSKSFIIISSKDVILLCMGKIVGIDFGLKRTGLAVSDNSETIAFPLIALPTHEVEKFLLDYIPRENVKLLVVGKSLQSNGTTSNIEKYTMAFINRLKKLFPSLTIERFDERFTSQIAQRSLIMGNYKKKDRRDKKNVDLMSATIILQDYLDTKKRI